MVFANEGEKGQEYSERERDGWHSGMLLASYSSGVISGSVYHAHSLVKPMVTQ